MDSTINPINWLVSARPITTDNKLSTDNEIIENSLVFGRFEDHQHVSPFDDNSWVNDINSSDSSDIIFYLHGFNNPPYKKVLERVKNIKQQINACEQNQIDIIPVFWPTQKDLMPANNYFQDQQWADQTAHLLQQYLHPVLEKLTNQRIHFIAHSMGARVLLASLQKQQYPHLKHLFLIAPDIENEALEVGEKGEMLSDSFDHITIFYAKDDLALRTSVIANIANKVVSKRLGQSGPENPHLLPHNVQAIDCDDINFNLDKVKGHSYFVSKSGEVTPVIDRIVNLIINN